MSLIDKTFCAFTITVFLALLSANANAAGTRANTTITNSATLQFARLGVSQTATASVSISVNEILDVSTSWQDAANVKVMSPSSLQVLSFLVVNLGNGVEDFILNTATPNTSPEFDPSNIQIWEDTNDDNLFSTVNDTLIPLGGTIRLDGADASADSQVIFLVSDIPAGVNVGEIGNAQLVVTSATAEANSEVGNVGGIISNGGDGATIDAVVGVSGAESRVSGVYEVIPAIVTITKTEAVSDNRGGSLPYPGSVIRYTLQVDVSGTDPVNNLVITDVIPEFTAYDESVDSILLDNVRQTNAADAPTDYAYFDSANNAITVDFSQGGTVSITPPQTFTISFEVTIN